MSEIYSTTERAIIFTIVYAVSLVVSLIFLYRRVDYKRTSLIIFISCWIYFALFISLNIIGAFDLFYGGKKGFEKFSKFISGFYTFFSCVDKALGFVIFNGIIYYLESGYYNTWKKFLDYLIRNYNSIKKMGKCKIIAGICGGVLIVGGFITLLVIYRDHFGYSSPLDYIFAVLDSFGMIKIYCSVGFFIIQIILEYKRIKDEKLIIRYYRYSIIKIIEKTESYFEKMKHCYEVLYQEVQNLDKNISPDYNNYLKVTLQQIKEKINKLELEGNGINENNNMNNNMNYNMNFNMNYNMNFNMNNNINVNNYNLYNNPLNEINYLKTDSNQNQRNIQTEENSLGYKEKTERGDINKKDNDNDKEKDRKMDIPTCIRKYKKYDRRIYKYKNLYKEFIKEKQQDINKIQEIKNSKCCPCIYIILFIAFIIIIVTDFLLPFFLNTEKDYYADDDEEFEKEESHLSLAIGVLIAIAGSILLTSYTIVIIYSTTRKVYITGDFLYDKQINDNLNLIKTVQIVCGYSFSLIYCNLYFWKTIDNYEKLGKVNFYKKVVIPDYKLKSGMSIFMIAKIVVIVISMIANQKLNMFWFKNDLAEYNMCQICSSSYIYDNEMEFNRFLYKKDKIYNILNK